MDEIATRSVEHADQFWEAMFQLAGMTGEQIVAQLGGLEWMIDRLCAICKVTRADIAALVTPS